VALLAEFWSAQSRDVRRSASPEFRHHCGRDIGNAAEHLSAILMALKTKWI
jgi:hypothetical protein